MTAILALYKTTSHRDPNRGITHQIPSKHMLLMRPSPLVQGVMTQSFTILFNSVLTLEHMEIGHFFGSV